MLDLFLSGLVLIAPVVIGVLVIFVPSKTDDPSRHKHWVSGLLIGCLMFSAVTSLQQFRAASDAKSLAKNVEQAVNTLSGADSYPCVISGAVINNRAILSIFNRGPNMLTGVNVRVNRTGHMTASSSDYFFEPPVNVGTLAQKSQALVAGGLPISETEIRPDGIARYVVQMTTQNGEYFENLWFKRDPATRQWASTVYGYTFRQVTSLHLSSVGNGDLIELPDCRSKDLLEGQATVQMIVK